ncbi:uncharacterized protein DS421_7g207920 [Arachis hypogaea]|nr:uncharacterized protein DS421_7g207920 [Arachis hypogaea]
MTSLLSVKHYQLIYPTMEMSADENYFCDAEEPLSDKGMDVDSEANDFFYDNFYENWDGRSIDGISDLEVRNHELLADKLNFMLPRHRKMDAGGIDQMNMMLKVGIKTP